MKNLPSASDKIIVMPKIKEVPEHKDKLGKKLAVGQYVAYPMHNMLEFGRVEKINPRMISVGTMPNARSRRSTYKKYPHDLVVMEDSMMTWYVLKNSA